MAAAAEYRQVEALVSGIESDTVGKVGDGRTQVHLVLVVDRTALVLVVIHGATVLGVDTEVFVAVVAPHGLSLVEIDEIGQVVHDTRTFHLLDLAADGGKIGIDTVGELTGLILPAEFELETVVVDLAYVLGHARGTRRKGRRQCKDLVDGILIVEVHPESQPVVQETRVDTGIELPCRLPFQIRVGQHIRRIDGGNQRAVHGVIIAHAHRRAVHESAQRADITVDTVRSAELQERNDLGVDIAHEPLVGDRPPGRHRGEIAPAGFLRQFGAVESVGAEIDHDVVTVVERIADTAEVTDTGNFAYSAAHAFGRVGRSEVQVVEIAAAVGQAVGRTRSEVAPLVLVGHTDHRVDRVLAERVVVVGEVLPHVEAVHRGLSVQLHLRARRHGEVGRHAVETVIGRFEPVTDTRRDGKALDGGENQRRRTAQGEVLMLARVAVIVGKRVDRVLGGERNADVIALLVLHEHVVALLCDQLGHVCRQVVLVPESGQQRIHAVGVDELVAVAQIAHAVAAVLRTRTFDRIVGREGEPFLDLVVAVELEGDTLQPVLVAVVHTVVVHIRQRSVNRTIVVGHFDAGRMALERTVVAVKHVEPVGISFTVPRGQRLAVAGGRLIGHVLLGIHQVGLAGQRGDAVGEIVEDAAVALLTLFGGDKYDAVTGLDTVDGRRGTVLEDLHRLDRRGVEVGNVRHLQAVHHIEGLRCARIVRAESADTDRGTRTRSGRRGEHLHARGLSLQGLLCVLDRTRFEHVALH